MIDHDTTVIIDRTVEQIFIEVKFKNIEKKVDEIHDECSYHNQWAHDGAVQVRTADPNSAGVHRRKSMRKVHACSTQSIIVHARDIGQGSILDDRQG